MQIKRAWYRHQYMRRKYKCKITKIIICKQEEQKMKKIKNKHYNTSSAPKVKEIFGMDFISKNTVVSICGAIFEHLENYPLNYIDSILHKPTNTAYYSLDSIINFLNSVRKNCDYNISTNKCQLNDPHCVYQEIEKSLIKLYELRTPKSSPVPFDETVPF